MKNLVKKTLAIAASALCLGAGLQAFAASTGDVWSIMQCDASGITTNRFATTYETSDVTGIKVSNPIPVKETIYFRMRLWNHRAVDPTGAPYYLPWKQTYADERIATSDTENQASDWDAYRPRVGIFTAGADVPTFATLIKVDNTSSTMFTDLVFEYVVQPGDFGLPVDIALDSAGTPVPSYTGSGAKYYFDPDRTVWTFKPWDYKNDTFIDEEVVWTGGDMTGDTTIPAAEYSTWTTAERALERSGETTNPKGTSDFAFQNGFYVQTVRFATTDADGNLVTEFEKYSVPKGSTKTVGIIAGDNTLASARRFYIWSDNENAVKLAASSGVTVERIDVDPKADVEVMRDVATVTLTGDTATFAIYGVETNLTANLVLSATPHYNYMNNGSTKVCDFVTVAADATEPEPASLAVTGTTPMTASGERWTCYRLSVALSYALPETAPANLAVTLTPSVEGGDWKDYVFFSNSEGYDGETPPTDSGESALNGIIMKGARSLSYDNGVAKDVYVYPIRSDAQATVLKVVPSCTGDDATNPFVGDRMKEFSGRLQTAVAAELAASIAPTKNRPTELQIRVSDAYADEKEAGYKLEYWLDKTDRDSKVTIPNLSLNADGILVDSEGAFPQVTYTSTSQTNSMFTVTSPLGKASVSVDVTVAEVANDDVTAKITAGASEEGTVVEGSTLDIEFNYRNFATAADTLYAYLVCTDDPGVSSTMFSNNTQYDIVVCSDNENDSPTGYPLEGGTTSNPVPVKLTPLTSCNANFRVVLSRSATWGDPTQIYEDAPSSLFALTVENVSADASAMWMYVTTSSVDAVDKDSDGDGEFAEKILYGQSRSFRARINDQDYDKTNGMVAKWTVRKAGANSDSDIVFEDMTGATVTNKSCRIIAGDGATLADPVGWIATGAGVSIEDPPGWFTYTFPGAGTYTVTAEVWDSIDYPGRNYEEDDGKRGSIISKTVTVTGLSSVKVTTNFTDADGDNILRESVMSRRTVTVALADWTDETPVMVELAVFPKNASEANPGNLEFSSDDVFSTDDATRYYRHTFTVGNYEDWVLDIDLDTLDGIANTVSGTKGFDMVATVLTTDTLPSKQMTAAAYYGVTGSIARPVKLLNSAPRLEDFMPTIETTNSSNEAMIEWGVRDADFDLNAIWTNQWFGGVKADDEGNYPSGKGVVVVVRGDNVKTTAFFTDGSTYGQLEPTFIDDQSEAKVYIDFYDKDRSKSEVSAGPYVFPAQAVKILTTVANMPAGGNSLIPMSSKYAMAKGVGYGHTWISGGDRKFMSAENFYLSWNCGTANSTEMVYAFGYSVGDVDRGQLSVVDGEPYDVWIGSNGGHKRNASAPTAETGYYTYVDPVYDSFFYGWISATEPGGTDYAFSANPQMGEGVLRSAKVKLPTEKSDDGAYEETYIEAVFSREYNQYDQMGDINADGIPDYYMLYPNYAGGAFFSDLDGSGAELVAINAKNDDEDYYPTSSHMGGSTLTPGAVSDWATKGQPFNAFREIRGYHEGLNFGMFQFARDERITYRPDTQLAYGKEWISEIEMSDREKRALLTNVLNRRKVLVEKLLTTGELSVNGDNNEYTEYDLINALLAQIYYKGMAPGADIAVADENEKMFYPDATYVAGKLTNDIERTIVDDDTGTNVIVMADAWLRTYRPAGATEPTILTNFVNLVAYTNTNLEATDPAYVTYLQPWELYTADNADIGNWLNKEYNADRYAAQQATAKAYINYTWRHINTTGEWGWTCENRTDPTIEDTDGDGMPDGYEYYMWYAAVVGGGSEQLTGCRFNLKDLEDYSDVITSAEIASLYNPNRAISWTSQDTDNDGIYDLEEFLIGTSPVHWDSDRDGLSDLYEVMYNINPISAAPGQNGAMNGDGDFMAYWKADASDPLGAFEYAYVTPDGTCWLLDKEYSRTFDGYTTKYISPNKETLTIPAEGDEPVHGIQVARFNGGFILPTEDTANYAERNAVEFTAENPLVFSPVKTLALTSNKDHILNTTVSLYHHQVHNYFGFDPRTGWHANANGSLSPTGRWLTGGAAYNAGTPVHTSAFTAINEYLLLKYRYIVKNITDAAKGDDNAAHYDLEEDLQKLRDNKTTIANIIGGGTTNPNADFSDVTWGDDTTTYARTQHGADTDGDGVPDGWELYIGVNPNRDWKIAKGQPGYDALYYGNGNKVWTTSIAEDFSDGLTLAREYAGTDSCGVYEACPTIYANHPSQGSGWFNKFFPTDPRNDDTDGDGLSDGEERSTMFTGSFVFNRWGQTLTATARHSFIYGNPTDNGSKCIRGGGLNPCSIDTDLDGLPDPWEKQYAGLLFLNNDIVETVLDEDGTTLRRIPEYVLNSSVYDDVRAEIQAHWGIYTNSDDQVYHILLGMDGTYNDATSPTSSASTDRDWDGDGLQNWQEYMVQAMRHFRYDDSRTPLMGRDIPYYDDATHAIKEGQWNGDTTGFLRVSYTTPFSADPDNLNALVAAGYPNFAKYVEENPDYLRDLGYFAEPPKSWDIAGSGDTYGAAGYGNLYMMPPKSHRDMVLSLETEIQQTNEDGLPIWVAGNGMTYTGALEKVNGAYSARFQVGENSFRSYRVTPVMTTVTFDTMHSITTMISTKYVGTDPRVWDTDGDGMDDYYELYHGLNPLLGSIGSDMSSSYDNDVIYKAYGGVSAWQNAWVGWENELPPPYDPIKYPWMMGTADCDADGDGLRNYEEMLLANVASPNAAHTDPTPLWMTDITVPSASFDLTTTVAVTNYVADANGDPVYDFDENGIEYRVYTSIDETVVTNATLEVLASPSYTALYYRNELYGGMTTNVTESANSTMTTITTSAIALDWGITEGTGYDYIASFEMNEGYDTDNDWRTDSGEVKSLSRKNSDPLDFSDPAHRQSVWFGGKSDPGALISFLPTYRKMNGVDFFKQFTVEAWVKPEASANGQDQYIVSRASRYGYWDLESWADNGGGEDAVIRMNFALGLDASGHVFAETQNTTELSSRVTGEKAVDGEWVHLAATYDGTTLRLYRNGKLEASANTTLIPANGTTVITQSPQAITKFPYDTYHIVPSITIIGGRACGDGAFAYVYAATASGWDDVATDFYKGSVSEVRTWDGARSAAEIASEYNVTYAVDDLKQKRLEFYASWRDGATRNDNDGKDTLPAELIQYYNMATLPGATDASFVRIEPTGFQKNVVGYARNPDDPDQTLGDSLKVGWWSALLDSPVATKVYTSGFVVPWVQNMAGHLPKLCGSISDSVYWSENYAGYTPASFQGLDSFEFPNTLNPYTLAVTSQEDAYLLNKYSNLLWHDTGTEITDHTAVITNDTEVAAHYMQYRYDYRLGMDGTTDLLPVGSAYAKRSDSYWDGQGPETAWQETGVDENANDLPDWWEQKYGLAADATPNTEVTRNGVKMPAYEAYIRDLAAGMLPTKAIDTAYVNREDFDKNGLPDWWTDIYGVAGDAAADDDNDGLSNYTEFLLSEYFDLETLTGTKATFDPTKAKSISIYDSDYFFKVGQLYVGEIFTDHDFVEDVWEDEQGGDYASRYTWDSNKDYDEDGWSNYAERRFAQFTTSMFAPSVSHMVGDSEVKDMPIPTVKLTLRYNADQPLNASGGDSAEAGTDSSSEYNNQIANAVGNIVVQTFTKSGLVVPDATYTLQPGVDALRYFNLGAVSGDIRQGTLAPGHVKAGDVQLLVMQTANSRVYRWSIYGIRVRKGTYDAYLSDVYRYGKNNIELLQYEPSWLEVDRFSVILSGNSTKASLALSGETIGTLDVVTGEFSIDTSKLNGATDVEGNTIDLDVAQFQFNYISRVPTIQSNNLTLYLGEPNTGYVKEGENTIVAFIDLDGDGKYTNGEPMGTTVADVGWHQGAAEIELTDTSPIITRANLLDGYSDRSALYGTEDGDIVAAEPGTLSGGKYERIRVIRTQVDGYGIATYGIPNRVIVDKVINLDQRSFLYEGDVLEYGDFDIDWDDFQSEIMNNTSIRSRGIDPTEVAYRIVLGNGTISTAETNNLYSIATVRHFDSAGMRTIPQPQSPGSQASAVFGSRPVFKWTMKNTDGTKVVDNNSYTAFRVQVRENDGTTVVYDSGLRRAPARDLNGVYTFVPDVYAGDLLEPAKNYKWFVSMYNSKFQTNAWSDDVNNTFRMNALTNSLGTIKVCARYFGPDTVLSAGTIRIEAFDTPDFTGDPVARTYVAAKSAAAAADTKHEVNATLVGLAPGKYYVRGYVDLNSYGTVRQKDAWESWGYVCKRDGADSDIYTPSTIVIDDTLGQGDVFDLYIEDVDTNGNCLPDAWEYARNGKLDNGTENITDTLDAGIEIRTELVGNLKNQQNGSPAVAGLAAYVFSVMSNSGVAALVLDAEPGADESYTLAAGRAAGSITTTAEATDVSVTSIGAEETTVKLAIKGAAKVTTTSKKTGKTLLGASASIYTADGQSAGDAQLLGIVEYATSLSNVEWKDSGTRVAITVAADGSFETEPFDVPKPTEADGKCFFRVRLAN